MNDITINLIWIMDSIIVCTLVFCLGMLFERYVWKARNGLLVIVNKEEYSKYRENDKKRMEAKK